MPASLPWPARREYPLIQLGPPSGPPIAGPVAESDQFAYDVDRFVDDAIVRRRAERSACDAFAQTSGRLKAMARPTGQRGHAACCPIATRSAPPGVVEESDRRGDPRKARDRAAAKSLCSPPIASV